MITFEPSNSSCSCKASLEISRECLSGFFEIFDASVTMWVEKGQKIAHDLHHFRWKNAFLELNKFFIEN